MSAAPSHHDLQGRNRWLVLGLALISGLLVSASYFFPYWNIKLVAPQYPKGLVTTIFLHGVGGDVHEVDLINHYIGMHKLTEAAPFERMAGPYALVFLAVLAVVGVLFLGRKPNWLLIGVALALPLGFLADTMYWMYRFGHNLDATAAIDFPPFMPQLFGHGQIGQFHTWAWPGSGFWMAVAGSAVLIGAVLLRQRLCRRCPSADICGASCPHRFVLPPRVRA